MGFGFSFGFTTSKEIANEEAPVLPTLLTDGLVGYIDADSGLTTTGDQTQITQAVGVATFAPLPSGTGPTRDDLGFGRMGNSVSDPAGVLRGIKCAASTGLVTSNPAVLSTFGPTTSDFTILMVAWPFSSNSNWFCWGIGNATTNTSISGTLSSSATMTLSSQSVGGTGTITLNTPSIYTRTKWPTIVAWRLTAGVADLYINNLATPKLTAPFTWTSNPNHTRVGFFCRPDLSPDLGMSNAQARWAGLYNRALTNPQMLEMGRYLAYHSNLPMCGWGVNQITPRVT